MLVDSVYEEEQRRESDVFRNPDLASINKGTRPAKTPASGMTPVLTR